MSIMSRGLKLKAVQGTLPTGKKSKGSSHLEILNPTRSILQMRPKN